MYVSNLLILMSACCEKTNYFSPQLEEWCQQYNFEWEAEMYCQSARYSQAELKMGTHVKTTCCQVQMNNMHSSCRCVDELHYPKSIKEGYHWAWILHIYVLGQSVVMFVNMKCILSCRPRIYVMDADTVTAIDHEWQTNFGAQESVCTIFCFHTGFKSVACIFTPRKKLWNLFSL